MLAIITGGTKGIGRAIALKLAQKNINIVAISSSEQNLNQLKILIEKSTEATCYTHVCDLKSIDDRKKLLLALTIYQEDLSILVNNFGRYTSGSIDEITTQDLINNFDQNVVTAFEISQLFIPTFKQKQSGFIFNILSVLSKSTRVSAAAYTMSKHAMDGLNKLLTEELRDYQVKVCGIFPGSVNTSAWDGIDAEKHKMIQPEDIAEIVASSLTLSDHMFVERIDLSPLRKDI